MLEINYKNLRSAGAQGGDRFSRSEQMAGRIAACAGVLEGSSPAFSEAAGEIRKQSARLQLLLADGRRYCQALEEIAGIYQSTEKRICCAGKKASLEREDTVKTRASDDEERKRKADGSKEKAPQKETAQKNGTAKGKDPADAKGTAEGIDPEARRILLSAGLDPRTLDLWEAQGLHLTAEEAKRYCPILLSLARGRRYLTAEEFASYASSQLEEYPSPGGTGGNVDVTGQTAYLGAVTSLLLSCFPNIAMTMDRTVEVPIGPGVSAYCSVSGSGKASSGSSVKVTEALNAHSGTLKEGIAFSSDAGTIAWTGSGRKITVNTQAGRFSSDGKSASWSAEGKLSEDTTCELKLKVNYETGETSCEESLTTRIEQAQVTTTMGVKSQRTQSGPQLYPGYEKDMKIRARSQAVQDLLLEGMAPGMLTDLETLLGITGAPALQQVLPGG